MENNYGQSSSHNSSGNYGGVNIQSNAAHNSHQVKDPLDHIREKDSKKEGLGFWHRFIFHEEIQAAEAELQYLNSTKSDKGGTSVGISDARLRFLALKSHGIIKMSFISLCICSFSFVGLYFFVSQLAAVLVSLFILFHTFFPAYIVYGMERFVDGDRFTKPFFTKIRTIWRVFEFTYLMFTVAIIYLSKVNWNMLFENIKNYEMKLKLFKKVMVYVLQKFQPEQIAMMFSVYGMVLLLGIVGYLLVSYKRAKWARKIQNEIIFEHSKEIKRPAQLARIKSGKVRN